MAGIDYSTPPLDAGLAARTAVVGAADPPVRFAIGYVSTLGNPKNITRMEYANLVAAGLRVGLVFETYAGRALDGLVAGQQDGELVEDQLDGRAGFEGLPLHTRRIVYQAVDRAVAADSMSLVLDYFRGVGMVRPVSQIGVYGSYDVCSAVRDAGLARYFWQTGAWSQGQWSPDFHIIQRARQILIGSVLCDVDEWNDQLTDHGLQGEAESAPYVPKKKWWSLNAS